MTIQPFNQNRDLGALKALLSPHVFSEEVTQEMDRFPSQTIIGLGQGGGRIAAEFSRFGLPTFLVNSSETDMNEHRHLISDERRILTKSEDYPDLEGTDKNARLGFSIAKENKDKFKELVLQPEVQEADFVWVSVSLGGGTGNGALKVVLQYLQQIRARRVLPDGKIPFGVICSLPSSDEKGSSFRENALAGVKIIQDFMKESKMGSVLVIDNEKINDYYAKTPLETYAGTTIDAKSYSNMTVATTVMELCTLPLLEGRVVFDKTELLSALSTPAWLSIAKTSEDSFENLNLETTIQQLYQQNEVLASYEFDEAINGAIAAMYPATKNLSPKIGDDVYRYASSFLKGKINQSLSKNSKVNDVQFYGIALVNELPSRIPQLRSELDEWKQFEKEQEEKRMQKSNDLDGFDDFFSSEPVQKRQSPSTLDDLIDDDEDNTDSKKKTFTFDDLEDADDF